ncbi:MAG: hypothetical protein A4S09_07070 [Proteobacteria bacterium SG_bin7]|nr:MAG: hypothetical protein A4S09_07070 [Proteobacteria bacterium SG_bin7]
MYTNKICLGWREWVSLPTWKINKIKAKLDSGARTSALHAEDVEIYRSRGRSKVRFRVFPLQKSKRRSRKITAELIELRKVRSSDGVVTERPVVSTDLSIGDEVWPIEVTLVNRDIMGFRMLIGRAALKHRAVIDPGRSYLAKKRTLSLIELL